MGLIDDQQYIQQCDKEIELADSLANNDYKNMAKSLGRLSVDLTKILDNELGINKK